MKELRLADGRLLCYREAGSGPPLVLVHGWAMSSAVFAEALDKLSDQFRVLAPDLRGHGGSGEGPGYRFADFTADLEEWMTALDLRDAILGGWSMGGQVLMELYPVVRQRVRRLLLIDTTPCFTVKDGWPEGLPSGQVRAMARDLKRNYEKTMGEFFALQFAGEEIGRERYRRIVDFAVRQGRLPAPGVALAALESLRQGDLRERLSDIDCSVLVMHGELDRITPVGAAHHLVEHLPQGELALFSDTGHAPFLSQPEKVVNLWREFCA